MQEVLLPKKKVKISNIYTIEKFTVSLPNHVGTYLTIIKFMYSFKLPRCFDVVDSSTSDNYNPVCSSSKKTLALLSDPTMICAASLIVLSFNGDAVSREN